MIWRNVTDAPLRDWNINQGRSINLCKAERGFFLKKNFWIAEVKQMWFSTRSTANCISFYNKNSFRRKLSLLTLNLCVDSIDSVHFNWIRPVFVHISSNSPLFAYQLFFSPSMNVRNWNIWFYCDDWHYISNGYPSLLHKSLRSQCHKWNLRGL